MFWRIFKLCKHQSSTQGLVKQKINIKKVYLKKLNLIKSCSMKRDEKKTVYVQRHVTSKNYSKCEFPHLIIWYD